MRSVLHLIHLFLVISLLMGCSASPTPTASIHESPSPIPQTEEASASLPTAASTPMRALVAGQWNTLFYHPQLEKVILVNGGPDSGKPETDPLELWAWDGTEWTLVSADPQGPHWRNFGGAAFDTTRNRLVIYGGVQGGDVRTQDTWEWDGETWTRFEVTGPGFREGPIMVYDAARGKTILFGGANEKFELFGDTWEWDGNQWTLVSTSGPSPRFPSAIVYDAGREKVLLFSGHFVSANDYVNFSDFWEWDGTSWSEIIIDGEKPSARNIAQMVFMPPGKQVLLLGGGEGEFSGDMWAWGGTAWTQATQNGAPARSGMGGAYDPSRDQLVVFGGVEKPGGKAITDTWEWDGQNWICVHGCQ